MRLWLDMQRSAGRGQQRSVNSGLARPAPITSQLTPFTSLSFFFLFFFPSVPSVWTRPLSPFSLFSLNFSFYVYVFLPLGSPLFLLPGSLQAGTPFALSCQPPFDLAGNFSLAQSLNFPSYWDSGSPAGLQVPPRSSAVSLPRPFTCCDSSCWFIFKWALLAWLVWMEGGTAL